jgi:hypothetical protein
MSHSTRSDRRKFLKSSASIAAAATAVACFPWAQPGFANTLLNDRPRIGCIGLGGMGRGDAHGHRIRRHSALCDVDENQAKKANDDPNIGGGKADLYGDYRKVLERADIDVVSVVTPDHWHVKIAIEASAGRQTCFLSEAIDADARRESTDSKCLPQITVTASSSWELSSAAIRIDSCEPSIWCGRDCSARSQR